MKMVAFNSKTNIITGAKVRGNGPY